MFCSWPSNFLFSLVGCGKYLFDPGVVFWWRSVPIYPKSQDFTWESGSALPATDGWFTLRLLLYKYEGLFECSNRFCIFRCNCENFMIQVGLSCQCVSHCALLCVFTESLCSPVSSWAKHLTPGPETPEYFALRFSPQTSRWPHVLSY